MSRMAWTPFILDAVERKKESGVPLKAIARALGCSYESLRSARAYDLRRRALIKYPVMLEAEALERIAKARVSTGGKIR